MSDCQLRSLVTKQSPAKAGLLAAFLLGSLALPLGWAWGFGGAAGGDYQGLSYRLPPPGSSLRAYRSLDSRESGSGVQGDGLGQRFQLAFGTTGRLTMMAFIYTGARGEQNLPSGRGALGLAGMLEARGPRGEISLGARERNRGQDDQGSSYQLSYTSGRIRLQGHLMDVGGRFPLSEEALRQGSVEDAKALREAAGTRNVDLTAAWSLSRGASLSSHYSSLRNDKPGDERNGLTTTDTAHTFVLGLGPSSRLQASLSDHAEAWDPSLAKADLRKRTSTLEFSSQFGSGQGNSVRMALTNLRTREGQQEKAEGGREVHLKLAPSPRLALNLDRITKTTDQGSGNTTQTVTAAMQLAPNSQLTAAVKTLSPERGGHTRESRLKLDTALGGGSAAAKLVAERAMVRPADGSAARNLLKWQLTGEVGTGAARTNVAAAMQEERGVGATGKLSRTAAFHLDRALGSRVKLTADREEKATGTNEQSGTRRKSALSVVADLTPAAKLTAKLVSQASSQGDQQSTRDLLFEHQTRAFRVRGQHQSWLEGRSSRSAHSYQVDVPRGELPDWAKNILTAHQFADAKEHLAANPPAWLEMPFAGFRVWGKTLRGGPDEGMDGKGFAHRRMLGGRYHLLLASEDHPEAQDGDRKGRPLPLRRRMVDVGTPIRKDLVVHSCYSEEASTLGSPTRRHDLSLGLQGRLSDQEQMEASVSRETGTWEDKAKTRTSVSVMYALKVSEEQQVSVKGGYAWSEDDPGERGREYRLSLGYSKPI